jgi:hypothetical protein
MAPWARWTHGHPPGRSRSPERSQWSDLNIGRTARGHRLRYDPRLRSYIGSSRPATESVSFPGWELQRLTTAAFNDSECPPFVKPRADAAFAPVSRPSAARNSLSSRLASCLEFIAGWRTPTIPHFYAKRSGSGECKPQALAVLWDAKGYCRQASRYLDFLNGRPIPPHSGGLALSLAQKSSLAWIWGHKSKWPPKIAPIRRVI